MAETKRVIDIKKRKLKEELAKEEPDKQVVERLEYSISRHKQWEKLRRNRKRR